MALFYLFFIVYLMLTTFNNGSHCKDTLTTECDCQSSANMDIVFAIDTTCFNNELLAIKSFLLDIIERNYFTSNTHFGFVLFNNHEINSTSITLWTDDELQLYITDMKHKLDVFYNQNIDNALNKSINLFQNARRYTLTQRILVLITHNDPTKSQSVCQYAETLETEHIDIHIIKIYDLSQTPYQCLLINSNLSPTSAPNWLTLDFWSESQFYQIYPYLKSLFCTVDTTSAVSATAASTHDNAVEYLLTLRDINIYTLHSTVNAIRNKLTLSVQNYFSANVAFTYILTIDDIDYDLSKQDTTITFSIHKPGNIGWSDAEIDDIYASYEDGHFFYLLAYYLNLQWIINGEEKTANDVWLEFNNNNEIVVKRDLLNLLLTDFPKAAEATTTSTAAAVSTTTAVIVIEAPRLSAVQYDIKTSILMVEFDSGIDANVYDCVDILTAQSVHLLGTQTFCVWINEKIISYAIGNDNTLLSKTMDANHSIEFKSDVISATDDASVIQTDSRYLQQDIQFINDDNLHIKAIIDGITATTICNDLYYSSSRSLGHYGAALEYKWEVVWNNSVIYSDHHEDALSLSVMNDVLQYIDLVQWPILIEIRLNITNWLKMTDSTSYYTWIKHDYSLGIIYIIGDQFERKIAYNLKHKLRAVSHVSICNVSFTNESNGTITENKVYSTLLSQYELSYEWRMVDDMHEAQTIALDPNHYEADTFETARGSSLSSSGTILFADAYSLIPFGHYLFEISVHLFNSTNRDYVSAQVLPPNMYVKPSIFKIISADAGVNISVNDLFSIKDPYANIIDDPYNLSLTNMLSNVDNGYILQWKCFSKYLTNSESSNVINEFQIATTSSSYTDLYNVSTFSSCEDHLIFDTSATSLSFGVGELLISNKYIFEMTVYDPYYDMTLINHYMLWINPGLLPIVTIHTSQIKHQNRKKCNANDNRLVFVAEIENLAQLKRYYNFNDDPTDNIKAYLQEKRGSSSSSSSSSDSDEEYRDMMKSDYKHIHCYWYSQDIHLKCKQIKIRNNKLMIKQQRKEHKQCIKDGGVYTFNVQCTLDNGLVGSSSITIGTNTAPAGGYCYVKGYDEYAFNDTIVIEIDSNEYQTELSVICMNWNDEHMPLTQNIRTIYPALMDTCLSYGIKSASSVDWNQCKGSHIGEFEQSDSELILGLGEYLLIAVVRDDLEYDAVYKLPNIKVTEAVFDSGSDTDTVTTKTPVSTAQTPSSTTHVSTIIPSTTLTPITTSMIKATTINTTDESTTNMNTNATEIPNTSSVAVPSSTTTTTTTRIRSTTTATTSSTAATSTLTVDNGCDIDVIEMIYNRINAMLLDLDYIAQHLAQVGDTQIYFQVLQSMANVLDHYTDNYGDCFSVSIKQLIFSTKIRIIELTQVVMDNNSTTKTYDNLQNQLNVISNVLNLYCAGSDAYNNSCASSSVDSDNNDYSSCITSSDIILQSSQTLALLSQYFTENASIVLFQIVEELVVDILDLDEFADDTLDTSMADILMDIISSIHIWFVLNLGSNSKYDDMQNINDLIHLITSNSVSNTTSMINENTFWSSCWMDIDLSMVQLTNMSECNGYSSNIVWPANITHYVDDIYDIYSTVQCLVTEVIYDDTLVLNIELKDTHANIINVSLGNITHSNMDADHDAVADCDGIEFTLCGTEEIYTLLSDYDDDSLLSVYNLPICEWSSLQTDNNAADIWNTSGCYVASYSSSCVTCKCTHLTLFKADAEEFEPQINIVTKSSYQNITADYIGTHPGPLIFVLISSLLCVVSWIVSIKYCKAKDETPLIAVPDIINKAVKRQMVNESGYALSLIEIHRDDIGACAKICNVFMLYMKDYHPILSIFTATKHTNYSTTQRIFCCFMYIMTVSAVSALFYGQKKETVAGSLVLLILGSLLTCIPVYFIIYLFQFSRPIEKDSEIKNAIMNAKLLKAPCHQLTAPEVKQLSLELCAKWLILEMTTKYSNRKRSCEIPLIYPPNDDNSSSSSQINSNCNTESDNMPPLPDSTRLSAAEPSFVAVAPPKAPPKRKAVPPPPPPKIFVDEIDINESTEEEEEHDMMAQHLLIVDDEHIPLAGDVSHSLMDEVEGEEESETPPWCRAPASWNQNEPTASAMNAPKPMIYEHQNRKNSYDAIQKHGEIHEDDDSESDYSAAEQKMDYLPTNMMIKSKKKRILMNAVHIIESEMVRKRLLREEYPLAHCIKHVAWWLMTIWCVLCMLLVIIYGAHFDLVYNACVAWRESNENGYNYYNCEHDKEVRRLMFEEEDECFWKDTLSSRINEDIMQYIDDIINSDDFVLNGIPEDDQDALIDGGIITNADDGRMQLLSGDAVDDRLDIYGAHITDSSKWIISCFVSILIGLIIWQPIWLFIISIVSVRFPSCGTLKYSKIVCSYCFGYFRKLDAEQEEEEMFLANKLNMNQIMNADRNKKEDIYNNNRNRLHTNSISMNIDESLRKKKIKDSFSVFAIGKSASIQPKIAMQQRQSQTFDESIVSRFSSKTNEQKRRSAIYDDREDERLEEEKDIMTDEEEESSKSSDLFGIGEDDLVYFEHANNRHHRAARQIFSFKEFILHEDEYDLSIDAEQFLSDIQN